MGLKPKLFIESGRDETRRDPRSQRGSMPDRRWRSNYSCGRL